MNKKVLKPYLKERKVKYRIIAGWLGLQEHSVAYRMCRKPQDSKWKLGELNTIRKKLGMTDEEFVAAWIKEEGDK